MKHNGRRETNSQKQQQQNQFTKHKGSVFGETILSEQLQTWQANSKRLITKMYLQYYLNCAISISATLHLFLPQDTDESSTSFKGVSVQSFICFGFCQPQLVRHIIVSPKTMPLCCVFYFYCLLCNFSCVLCAFAAFSCWCFLKLQTPNSPEHP